MLSNYTIRTTLLTGMLIILVACNPVKNESGKQIIDKEQVKKEIQAKEKSYAEIYNSGELKRIGYYADDAVSFAQNQTPLIGREAIIENLKVDVAFNTDKISFTTKEVFPSNDGNLVLEIGYYEVVDSANVAINAGNYMCLFEKRDGQYYCIREMSTSDGSIQ